MKKWECQVCGHIYDPAQGDPQGGVNPGTAFEDVPEEWIRPVCGSPKELFLPLKF